MVLQVRVLRSWILFYIRCKGFFLCNIHILLLKDLIVRLCVLLATCLTECNSFQSVITLSFNIAWFGC